MNSLSSFLLIIKGKKHMDTGSEFLHQASRRFAESFERINHAVGQLDDGDAWYRPSATSNSIGIILQHLTGNLSQWICSAIGGDDYTRNRPAEFLEQSRSSRQELLSAFNQIGNRIQNILKSTPPESLAEKRRVQGLDETVMSAILKACTHCELHAGQVVYIAKMILGDRYTVLWKPATKEQGLA
jgi:hypothetical protein